MDALRGSAAHHILGETTPSQYGTVAWKNRVSH